MSRQRTKEAQPLGAHRFVEQRGRVMGLRSLLVFACAAAGAVLALAPPAQDRLLYNHTPSAPVGFYVRIDAPVRRGVFVTVRAGDVAPIEALAHHFTGRRDRFIKRVAAIQGDLVCTSGSDLFINHAFAARRRSRDGQGRPLSAWRGCRVLSASEVLLLGDIPESFDGRYWGPVGATTIEGVWRRL